MDEFERPSSRSTPDSTDFEKIEKEDVMEAPSGFEPDSSTHLEDALRGGGDAPRIKLESPTASVSGPPTPVDDQGVFSSLSRLPPCAVELIYWRCPKTTVAVFGSLFNLLVALSLYSFVTVVSYAALSVLTLTFSFVTYRKCLSAFQKKADVNPFQPYLGQDSIDQFNQGCEMFMEKAVTQCASCLISLRHYFLIGEVVDSIKCALFLWTLAYVGDCFNLLTIVILAVVSLFTLPKIYEVHQEQIDAHVGMLMGQLMSQYPVVRAKFVDTFGGIWDKVTAFMPSKAKAQ